jgi:hypothetical protein
MKEPIRWWFVAAALICAALSAAGWWVTIHAFAIAPATLNASIFQTALFLMTLYPNIRWRQIISNAEQMDAEPMDTNDNWRSYSNFIRQCRSYSNFIKTSRFWCVGSCLMSAIALYDTLQKAGYLAAAH